MPVSLGGNLDSKWKVKSGVCRSTYFQKPYKEILRVYESFARIWLNWIQYKNKIMSSCHHPSSQLLTACLLMTCQGDFRLVSVKLGAGPPFLTATHSAASFVSNRWSARITLEGTRVVQNHRSSRMKSHHATFVLALTKQREPGTMTTILTKLEVFGGQTIPLKRNRISWT